MTGLIVDSFKLNKPTISRLKGAFFVFLLILLILQLIEGLQRKSTKDDPSNIRMAMLQGVMNAI